MHSPTPHFFTMFAAFFAIMNPIANTPIFLGLTGDLDEPTTRRIAFQSVLMAFLIVAVFSAAGHLLFDLFGITLPSFRIAGGLLVALVGFHLLQGNNSPVHKPKEADLKESKEADMGIAISPLAMPLLAGPGTLVTGMSYAAGGGPERIGLVLAAFFLICVLTYVCFVSGERLTLFLGKNLLMVVSRLMGLILTVIGTEMVIQGVRGAIAHAAS